MVRILVASLVMAGVGSLAIAQEAQSDSGANAGERAVQVAPPSQSVPAGEQSAAEAKSADEQLIELKGKLDGLDEPLAEMKSTLGKLSKIKVSGYLQTQFRMAPDYTEATDTAGSGAAAKDKKSVAYGTYAYKVGDFAGGTFGNGIESMLQLRRARIKIGYETDLSQAYVQFDCVPFTLSNVAGTTLTTVADTVKDSAGVKHVVTKSVATNSSAVLTGGGVTIKDAYLRFSEPWLKSFAIKAGVFDRPFGFEIGYSSSSRESPERSRVFQTLFPGERDLGVSLEYLPSDNISGIGQYINMKAGAFTGNGISVERDGHRDYIGRLGVSIPVTSVNLGIDAGFSGYAGKVLVQGDSVYETTNNAYTGKKAAKNSATLDRQYFGGDMEVYYGDVPVIGGTSVRAEVISGKQPGTSGSNASPKDNFGLTGNVYLRNFIGYYAMLIQNIDPIKSQLVLKYDVFDPNTDLAGDNVKSGADMLFSTIGAGLVYHWSENVKLTAYYDVVENEKTANVKVYEKSIYKNDIKDDVFTFRIQYKF